MFVAALIMTLLFFLLGLSCHGMSWPCCICIFILRNKSAFAAMIQVFVACQRSIPTTVILPKVELDSIETLEELTKQCCVDAGSAQASVEEDATMIKKKIMEDSEEKCMRNVFPLFSDPKI